ncbi:MAG: ribokinase [Mangrovibacterium sp.]
MGRILVIGSSNTDLIARVKRFPAAGETIEGLTFLQAMGGKGANQAVAARRAGGDVTFITCLGNDANGLNALKYYRKEGLDVSLSKLVDDVPSGTAMIWVNDQGENCIVITPGANNRLNPDDILSIQETIATADMVVLQMEIPYETVKAVCDLAHKYQTKILLNVAPARQLDTDLLKKTDLLIVNETEAEAISGKNTETDGTETVADALLRMGAKTVLLTLGEQGCFLKDRQMSISVPAFPVKAVDTTAAGDTFCGALAAQLSKGKDWEEILKFATAASAICVTRMGAQPSIPTEKEILEFLKNNDELQIK